MATQQGKGKSRAASPLADVQNPEGYVESRAHVFLSVESWRWWFRKHRAELFRRGAVLEIAGRIQVVAGKCDEAVLELGTEPRKTRNGAGGVPLAPLQPGPVVYSVKPIEPLPDDANEVAAILGGKTAAQAFFGVVSEESAKLQQVLGREVRGQPGVRRRPTTAEKREGKRRLGEQLSNLRDALRGEVTEIAFDGAIDLHDFLAAARRSNDALALAAKGVLSAYRDLDDWSQCDVDWVSHSALADAGSPVEWLEAIIAGLDAYQPEFRKVPDNAIPVDMIRRIAKICAEHGLRVTRNEWMKEIHGSGHVTQFERLVEIARLYSGHEENARGDVTGWLRHVATKEFCDGWNAYGERFAEELRATRARAD